MYIVIIIINLKKERKSRLLSLERVITKAIKNHEIQTFSKALSVYGTSWLRQRV